jgi:hypothetical protein
VAPQSPGKSHSLATVRVRSISKTSIVCLDNGTMCGSRIFMRSRVMSQRADSKSAEFCDGYSSESVREWEAIRCTSDNRAAGYTRVAQHVSHEVEVHGIAYIR